LRFTSISVEKYNVYVTYRKYDKDDNLIESGIQIIDISSKEKPYLVAEYITTNWPEKITVYDNYTTDDDTK